MNTAILQTEVQEYLRQHLHTDYKAFALKKSPFLNLDSSELTTQLYAKQKCKNKLPSWYNSEQIYYPKSIHIEQTSSEITASYKQNLVHGNLLIDLSGGFGVDSFYFNNKVKKVIHTELDKELSAIAAHNFKQLKASGISTHAGDGLDYIKNTNQNFDWIYIDPSRRNQNKRKVFLLQDCEPNIPEIQENLFQKTKNILLKTAPLLDLHAGANQLQFLKEIHIVAVANEVKEVLWVLDKGYTGSVSLVAANYIQKQWERFYSAWPESPNTIEFSNAKTYIYEPNAAILKSQCFGTLQSKFKLEKIAPNSHLFTNDLKIDFPGRRFKCLRSIPYHKKNMKTLGIQKANITTRNFRLTVATLRKKHRIKEGGERYLFFTTNHQGDAVVLDCIKI